MQGISKSLQNRFKLKWSQKQTGEGVRRTNKRKPRVVRELKKKLKKSKKPKWE